MTNTEKFYLKRNCRAEGYFEDKKSKFISLMVSVEDESEAVQVLNEVRKKYYDARHNCYAYVIGDNNEITRSSDDKEPSGSAGKPILETIVAEGIHNCIIVVTRYFGGTLLGVGGLVRAYTGAAKDAIQKAALVRKIPGVSFSVDIGYSDLDRVLKCSENVFFEVLDTKYGENIRLECITQKADITQFVETLTNATNARALITQGEEMYLEKEI